MSSPPSALPSAVTWPSPARRAAFEAWAATLTHPPGLRWATLQPADTHTDTSDRRYLRVHAADTHCIVMDAAPENDLRPFVQVAALIRAAGLHAPAVLAADPEQGFLLLSDLGSETYLDALREPGRADGLMRDALQALLSWQLKVPATELPVCDEARFRQSLALFPEWCVQQEFGVHWTDKQQQSWQRVCDRLVASALAQPRVAAHGNWTARKLMVCADHNPGILGFRHAMNGPITHDLASLLRDACISWDEAQELDWAVRWWQQARSAGLPLGEDFEADFGEFWRGLEWMGLLRHLATMGRVCRLSSLKHRDGQPGAADDLPRFFQYATRVALRYAPLKPLLALLEPLSGQRVQSGFTF